MKEQARDDRLNQQPADAINFPPPAVEDAINFPPPRAGEGRVGAQSPKELTLSRTFDAPRDVVFRAWTDARQVARWWGPRGFTNPVCEVDARPGGAIHIVMRGPEPWGDNPMTGVFQEVIPPERLAFISTPLNANGKPILETVTTVVFDEVQGKTRVTVHVVVTSSTPEAATALAGIDEGWRQTLDRLSEHIQAGR
jgi:uncharacterized protein YndB with AHSA1/START domain